MPVGLPAMFKQNPSHGKKEGQAFLASGELCVLFGMVRKSHILDIVFRLHLNGQEKPLRKIASNSLNKFSPWFYLFIFTSIINTDKYKFGIFFHFHNLN